MRVSLVLAGQRLNADLTAAAVAELDIVPGQHLIAGVKATQVRIYGAPG